MLAFLLKAHKMEPVGVSKEPVNKTRDLRSRKFRSDGFDSRVEADGVYEPSVS